MIYCDPYLPAGWTEPEPQTTTTTTQPAAPMLESIARERARLEREAERAAENERTERGYRAWAGNHPEAVA